MGIFVCSGIWSFESIIILLLFLVFFTKYFRISLAFELLFFCTYSFSFVNQTRHCFYSNPRAIMTTVGFSPFKCCRRLSECGGWNLYHSRHRTQQHKTHNKTQRKVWQGPCCGCGCFVVAFSFTLTEPDSKHKAHIRTHIKVWQGLVAVVSQSLCSSSQPHLRIPSAVEKHTKKHFGFRSFSNSAPPALEFPATNN